MSSLTNGMQLRRKREKLHLLTKFQTVLCTTLRLSRCRCCISHDNALYCTMVFILLTTINIRMFIGPCIIVIVEELETNLMSLLYLLHLIFAQHVSNINMSIFRSLRLYWRFTTSVALFCKDRCFCNYCNFTVCNGAVWCDVLCRLLWLVGVL